MNSEIIAVGIVLYNPTDIERLKNCIKSILEQTNKIYIFDNSSSSYEYLFPAEVVYISEKENKGMAYALNRIMENADADGFSWVITMDQDSILPDGLVSAYKKAIHKYDKLGIVCPQVIDSRRTYMTIKTNPTEEYVTYCITSGSCTSIKSWKELKGFDEWLFIDLVDNEFCKRLICSGYKILRLNELILNQEFGIIIPKSAKKQQFWIKLSKLLHNENIAKFSYKKFVSPMRVYYTNRNIIYVNRKLKKYGPVAYRENYNCNGYIGFLLSFSLPSLLRAQNKWKVLKAIFLGIHDGKKKNVLQWQSKVSMDEK